MSQLYELPELEEYDESFDEYDEYEDYDEAIRRRMPRRAPVKTAPRGSAYKPRPATTGPVTQAQLKEALAVVSRQVATNSTAIKTLDGRVRGVTTEQARTTAMLRKEIVDRKKDQDAFKKELQSTRELAALLPIIAKDNPIIGLLAASSGGGGLFGGGTSGADGTGSLLMTVLLLGELGK